MLEKQKRLSSLVTITVPIAVVLIVSNIVSEEIVSNSILEKTSTIFLPFINWLRLGDYFALLLIAIKTAFVVGVVTRIAAWFAEKKELKVIVNVLDSTPIMSATVLAISFFIFEFSTGSSVTLAHWVGGAIGIKLVVRSLVASCSPTVAGT